MPKSTKLNIYDTVQYWTIDCIGIPLCVRLNITPNMVTLLGFIPIVLQFICIQHCNRYGIHIAGLVNYWFDCLDGELARQTGQVTQIGGLLDSLHDVCTALMLLYFIDYRLLIVGVIITLYFVDLFDMSVITHTPKRHHRVFYLIHDNLIFGYLIMNEIILRSPNCRN